MALPRLRLLWAWPDAPRRPPTRRRPRTEGEGLAFTGEDEFADCQLVYGCCSPECQHHLLKGYVRDGKLVKVESGEVNESPLAPAARPRGNVQLR